MYKVIGKVSGFSALRYKQEQLFRTGAMSAVTRAAGLTIVGA